MSRGSTVDVVLNAVLFGMSLHSFNLRYKILRGDNPDMASVVGGAVGGTDFTVFSRC